MSFMFKPYRFTDPEAINKPVIPLEISKQSVSGNDAVVKKLLKSAEKSNALFLDGYVGAYFPTLCKRISEEIPDCILIDLRDAYKSSAELEALVADSLPQDRVIDPILLFGKSIHREFDTLFDRAKTAALKTRIAEERKSGRLVVVYGCGAILFREEAESSIFKS